jgi:nucleoside deoxyribosyltransferase
MALKSETVLDKDALCPYCHNIGRLVVRRVTLKDPVPGSYSTQYSFESGTQQAVDAFLPGRKQRVFLATPFFNGLQEARMDAVYSILQKAGLAVWCAAKDFRLTPKSSEEDKNRAFVEDCQRLQTCDFVVAITNDYDPGTMWEMGYAYSHGKKVIGLAVGLSGKFNLMLAKSCFATATTFEELEGVLSSLNTPKPYTGEVE